MSDKNFWTPEQMGKLKILLGQGCNINDIAVALALTHEFVQDKVSTLRFDFEMFEPLHVEIRKIRLLERMRRKREKTSYRHCTLEKQELQRCEREALLDKFSITEKIIDDVRCLVLDLGD